jgi:hypothetical protein
MTRSAARSDQVRADYGFAMAGRESMHGSKYHGEQQTKNYQTWSEMRHGDEFSESIARGCLRRTAVARQQWSRTSEYRTAGKRKLRTPFIKRGG